MGRGGGVTCTAPLEKIIQHFECVGRPPEDPRFCQDCLEQAQACLRLMIASREQTIEQVVSVEETAAAYRCLRKVTKGLDGLGQDVIGPALSVLLPVFASLFSHFLMFAVAPRDWTIAVIAWVKKSGVSRSDLVNFQAVYLLCFTHTHYI